MTELQMAHEKIMRAHYPEDIFGSTEHDLLTHVKKIYRQLSKAVHPESENGRTSEKLANEAFKKLNTFYQQALEMISHDLYGKKVYENPHQERTNFFVIKTAKNKYAVTATLAQGDLSTIYGGLCVSGEHAQKKVVIKVIENIANNDLAQNEIRILKIFDQKTGPQKKHLPILLDQFKTAENQIGIVLAHFDGFDLLSVHEKYPNGVPAHHVAWMLERTLSAIGFVHSMNIVHGNIDPAHIMIRQRDHNALIIDWSYASIATETHLGRFTVCNEDFSPTEVVEKKPPLPSADLYTIGKCMIYLLGGDITTDRMPVAVDERFQRFLHFMVRKSPLQRAQDAWETYAMLVMLRNEIWGKARFEEFVM